jgi:hypothetical protein
MMSAARRTAPRPHVAANLEGPPRASRWRTIEMSPQCYHCDAELVPQARFCHRCGTPTFSAYRGRPAAGIDQAERTRIKEEVASASQVPTTTRMTQTVLAPRAAVRAAAAPPLWLRVLRMRLWRRWYLWVGIGGLGVLVVVPRVIEHLESTAQRGQDLYHIVTKLAARCPSDSRPELSNYMLRIQGGAGGQLNLIENAMLFEYMARSVNVQNGSCMRIAEALAKPDRFDRLLQ